MPAPTPLEPDPEPPGAIPFHRCPVWLCIARKIEGDSCFFFLEVEAHLFLRKGRLCSFLFFWEKRPFEVRGSNYTFGFWGVKSEVQKLINLGLGAKKRRASWFTEGPLRSFGASWLRELCVSTTPL